MTLKEILLLVDDSIELSNDILNFTPIEKGLMLKIGSETIIESKKLLTKVTHEELEEKIRKETNKLLEKKEIELLVKDELIKKTEEKITNMYNTQLSLMEKKLETLQNTIVLQNEQLNKNESQFKLLMLEEVNKEREKCMLLLEEKEKQNQKNRELFSTIETIHNKEKYVSSKKKGDLGEDIFSAFAETFKDFKDYKLVKKATEGHKGDFHMFFEKFNILVDIKKYNSDIQNVEVDKITQDLMINDSMNFAWLVSLNTNIQSWSRYPIMYKWITTDIGLKCIIFVNNLLSYTEPCETLRTIWCICDQFKDFINKTSNEEYKINKLDELEHNVETKVNHILKRSNEMRRNLNINLRIIKELETEALDILGLVSNEIIKNECEKNIIIDEWWNKYVDYDVTNVELIISSTDMWKHFKKIYKEHIEDKKLTLDIFRKHIKRNICSDSCVENTKGSVLDIKGITLKEHVVPVTNKKLVTKMNVELQLPKNK
jgi:hypothetical protein